MFLLPKIILLLCKSFYEYSLVSALKKKKLVQLDNTEDGKIAHISQGEELQLNCSRQLTE